MKSLVFTAALTAVFWLTGCTNDPNTNMTIRNAAIGTAVGAGLGQMLGHDSKSTATGAAVGGIIGSQVQTSQ